MITKNIFTSLPGYKDIWAYVVQSNSAEKPLEKGTVREDGSLFANYDSSTMAGIWSTDGRYIIKNQFNLESGLQEIGDSAFEGAVFIKEVILPDTLTKIGRRAFASSRARLIHVPDSVTFIGEDAFADNAELILLCASESSAAAKYAREQGILYLIGN